MPDRLDVSFSLDREQLSREANAPVALVTHLRVPRVDGTAERPPLSVTLALDVSASMAGDPLRHVLRSAQRIATLLRPQDRLSVVAFSDAAFTVMSSHPADARLPRALARALAPLRVQSRTNIEAGLRLAEDSLRDRPADARGLVILLSDGRPNVGISDAAGLERIAQAATAATATLGYGPNHDDRVLGAIADGGRSTYAFVRDPHLCQLELGRALGQEGEATVEGIELRLDPCDGVRVAWLAGPGTSTVGRATASRVPDMAVGSEAIVAAQLVVTPPPGCDRLDLADVEVSYRVVGDPTPRRVQRRLEIAIGDVATPLRRKVARAAVGAEAGQRRREALALADRGRFDDAAAILESMAQRIRIAPGLDGDDALREVLEQLVDDIELIRRRPDEATYAAFRRGQRGVGSDRRARSAAARAFIDDAVGDLPDAELVVIEGPNRHASFPLGAENVLGRTLAADIQLAHESISRRHACVVAVQSAFWLLDLGSTNCTRVNGQPIDRHQLRDGDDVEIGHLRLRYQQPRRGAAAQTG